MSALARTEPSTSERPRALLPVATGREAAALLRELAAGRGRTVAAAVGALAVAAAAGMLGPLLLGVIVDRATDGAGADAVTAPALGLLATAVLGALATRVGLVLVAQVGQPVVAALRERAVERALRQPAERLERAGSGDLLARVTDDVAVMSEAVIEALPGLVAAALAILVTFAGLAAIDPRLLLAGLLAVPVQLLAVRWYLPRAVPAYARERIASGARAQAVLEAMGGVATVRALGLGPVARARVQERSLASVDAVVRTVRIANGFFARLNVAECVGTIAILAAGFALVDRGALSIGGATAGALLFVRLFDQFNVVLGTVDDAQRAVAALGRLAGLARLPLPAAAAVATGPHHRRAGAAELRLEGIRHAYDGGREVVRGVDLHVAPGEHVALVGVSGAGKSTLARIAAGLLTPTAGTATAGGPIAVVTQEVHVFSGTLAQDLRLAAAGATDAELERALDAVGALGWARALPAGLATEVGTGGVTLTATQAQQLALARLALADPAVAVLDEATAEAGSAGARVLEAAADAVLHGRTALVIAHRMTQAARADRVVVLEAGRAVESGHHDDLVAAGGVYAALWAAWASARA